MFREFLMGIPLIGIIKEKENIFNFKCVKDKEKAYGLCDVRPSWML